MSSEKITKEIPCLAIIIDAGVGIEPEKIINFLKKDSFDPQKVKYLLITHAHADHAEGASYIKAVTGCQVIAPASEATFLCEADE